MANLVKMEILNLPNRLKLVPKNPPDFAAENDLEERTFDIRVTNTSDRFASFQVELLADGTDPHSEVKWYSVEPEICAKKPPGDRTTFRVMLTKAPIPAYETVIELTVRVFSVESERLFTTQKVLLSIEKPKRSLRVYLPFEDLKVHPGDPLEIPVLIYNLSTQTKKITLNLESIFPQQFNGGTSPEDIRGNWFDRETLEQETRKDVMLGAGDSEKILFRCHPPQQPQTLSQLYEFMIAVQDQGNNSDSTIGRIEVLPYGVVAFECPNHHQTMPSKWHWQGGWQRRAATYDLAFKNASNIAHTIAFTIKESHQNAIVWSVAKSLTLNQQTAQWEATDKLDLEAGGAITSQITVQAKRPWLGLGRHLLLDVIPSLTNPYSNKTSEPMQVKPHTQRLELHVRPLVPFWLQLCVGLLGLLWLLCLRYFIPHHAAPINSVRLLGNAATVVSGSSDQTMQRWQVHDRPWTIDTTRLEHQLKIGDTGKPIRIIREIPANNNQIAAGLDDGEIQLWQVAPAKRLESFAENDRVFDLVFTRDSKFLFSGHGSSTVYQWNLENKQKTPVNQIALLNTAISSLAVSHKVDQPPLVAIVGQFNRFVLWNFDKRTAYEVNYRWDERFVGHLPFSPVFSQYDYINSLAIANDSPLLAEMADNRGYISLWNMDELYRCTQDATLILGNARRGNTFKQAQCNDALINQWQGGTDHQPIRAIALTDDGCYLASAGNDGRVLLWTLHSASSKLPDPMTVAVYPQAKLRSIDIQKPAPNYVLIASDAPQNQVRLYYKQVNPHDCRENSTAYSH